MCEYKAALIRKYIAIITFVLITLWKLFNFYSFVYLYNNLPQGNLIMSFFNWKDGVLDSQPVKSCHYNLVSLTVVNDWARLSQIGGGDLVPVECFSASINPIIMELSIKHHLNAMMLRKTLRSLSS